MTESQFYSFLTGGIVLVCVIGLAIAWLLWRDSDERRDAAHSALSGVAHEFRINLQRMVAELSGLANGSITGANGILPMVHPQLDGVNASLIKTDRNALAVIGAAYQELVARKLELRTALHQGQDISETLATAMDGAIDGIATLYMWEEHDGARPNEAQSTRSWDVRDWMKGHGFNAAAFPGMHLRDEVVERLRDYGLELTPKPLTHTAHEYYSMQYDRSADPRGVFGRRRTPKETPVEVNEAEYAPEDPMEADPAEVPMETAPESKPLQADEPQALEPDPNQTFQMGDTTTVRS